ncbi:anti-sigma factor [Saccharothrix syringae]|uniref:anti-sigma factor n=1 Tax=Saccharothrix syringae TaxID=103733 RepID=UPI00068F93B8|nr:anti-sigma factor [Saccharothrix syringae]
MTGERRDDRCPHEELAVGFAVHALEPDEEARLRDHLPGCERCREMVRATEEVTAAVGATVPQYDPPPRLRARLMAAIEDVPQERVAEVVPLAPRRADRRWRRALVAAAVVVGLVAVGAVGVRLNRLGDEVAAQTERANRLEGALGRAVDPATDRVVLRTPSGEAVAVLLSARDGATVVPTHLQNNDRAGQTYVVWGASTPEPVPLAAFDVTGNGVVVPLEGWTADAHKHTLFALSVEPGRTMPAKPSDVLAAGQVASA